MLITNPVEDLREFPRNRWADEPGSVILDAISITVIGTVVYEMIA